MLHRPSLHLYHAHLDVVFTDFTKTIMITSYIIMGPKPREHKFHARLRVVYESGSWLQALPRDSEKADLHVADPTFVFLYYRHTALAQHLSCIQAPSRSKHWVDREAPAAQSMQAIMYSVTLAQSMLSRRCHPGLGQSFDPSR